MNTTTHPPKRERNRGLLVLTLSVLVAVIAFWLATPRVIPALFAFPSAPSVADLFAVVNTLFSGLAFTGVVAAILLQRRELQLQRQELEETRDELRGQKDALVKQTELLTLSNVHQVLAPLLLEYRSSQMHSAITALWKLHKDHPTDFVAQYLGQLETPLHKQRRLVSHFYGLLSGLYNLGVVSPDVLYMYWSEQDLRIIPLVILPIELELERVLYRGPSDTTGSQSALARWQSMLTKLYDDAPRTAA